MEDKTLIRMWCATLITAVLIVNAFTLRLDHVLFGAGLAAIAGLGGYSIGAFRNKTASEVRKNDV